MNAILSLGRWLFAIPFALFGVFHFIGADGMSGMVPSFLPAGKIWVYLTGIGLVAAAVSLVSGKMDKLAATLLGIMMLIFALTIHLPGVLNGTDEMAKTMANVALLKDLALAGASFMYAKYIATDRSVIG